MLNQESHGKQYISLYIHIISTHKNTLTNILCTKLLWTSKVRSQQAKSDHGIWLLPSCGGDVIVIGGRTGVRTLNEPTAGCYWLVVYSRRHLCVSYRGRCFALSAVILLNAFQALMCSQFDFFTRLLNRFLSLYPPSTSHRIILTSVSFLREQQCIATLRPLFP